MDVIRTPNEARRFTWSLRDDSKTVGLVPTMGALHDGHLSLVRQSNRMCDATVATIFVNPAQFGPHEDLEAYPRTFERDCELLRAEGVAAVFVPASNCMYPAGFSTYVHPPEIANPLEGICRPGHFRGVATIVMKLFQSLPATHAFFGRKDYQQWKVIETMTREWNIDIEIIAGEIIRETDGLALSSRNRYLDDQGRLRARLLYQALERAFAIVSAGERDTEVVANAMRHTLREASLDGESLGVDKIDYAVLVDADTLSPIAKLDRPGVALIAAFIGGTRLIDNRVLSPVPAKRN
jgi:pantoate--beta-alanine ligase